MWGRAVSAGYTEARIERIAEKVAIGACVFFAAATIWELAGPIPGGHFGASASTAQEGENLLRWHIFAALRNYTITRPTPVDYYCHHPYGVGIASALGTLLFGHHWFTVRLPAVLSSTLSAPLVYAIAKAIWGVVPAAVATVVFVFVPIDLAFSSYANLEVLTIFFGLLFSWGTLRLWQSWQPRWVLVAAFGALGACQSDWVGLVLCAVVVLFAFVRAYVLPRRWYGHIHDRLYAQWLFYVIAAATGTVVLYLALFAKADHLADVFGIYHVRTAGSDGDWGAVLTIRRRLWLDWMLTRVGMGAILVGLPLATLRLVRHPGEIVPIAWTLAATFQYFVFKEAADVHIFWPQYYGPAAALSAGVITATLLWGRHRILRGLSAAARALASRPTAYALFSIAVLPIAVLMRAALPQLRQSRMTGGCFDDGGRYIATDADVAQFAQWAARDVPDKDNLLYMADIRFGYNAEYGAHHVTHEHETVLTRTTPDDVDRIAILDSRATPPARLRAFAKEFSVQMVGPYWRIDRADGGPNLVAIRYDEHQPGPLEWLFVSGTDLVRSIGPDPDPFATWEWNDALVVEPPPPLSEPRTPEDLRIAYNIAVAHGDSARAASLRARLIATVRNPVRIDFANDLHLLQIDVEAGAATVVTLLWETGASFVQVDTYFDVRCSVTAPPPLYWGKTDYFEKDMTPVPAMRPAMYRPRRLYSQRFIALHRLGVEACRGGFTGANAPRMANGEADLPVFTLR